MDGVAACPIYEFGEFQLDPTHRVLRSGSDGQPLDLTPRAFDTLLYLVEHAGQLVEKQDLLDALWPNVVVEEGNLAQTVHVLRRVLGEHPEDHRFIVTVPRRGYRFVGDVRKRASAGSARATPPLGPAADANAPPRRARLTALLVLALGAFGGALLTYYGYWESRTAPLDPQIRSIAVLPFVDMSPNGDQEHFSDGLSEELLNLLAQTPGLRVIARTSSFSFKDRNVDIATVAQKLKVGHVLEGSVRRSGDRVRITAQLVEASTSSHLWSSTYDRDLDDIFAVQSEIATAVADALHARLGSGAALPLAIRRDPKAYEHVLKGRFFYNRRADGDIERAGEHYRAALEVDPQFADAWSGLASVAFIETTDGLLPREIGLPRIRDAAQQALALDPNLVEARYRLAAYYRLSGEYETAAGHFRKAMTLGPQDPLMLSVAAGQAAEAGRFDEAIELQRRAVSRDPLSAVNSGNLGSYLFAAGRLEESKAELLRAMELNPELGAGVGIILILQRRFGEALAFIERSTSGPDRDQGLALVYYALGRQRDSDAALTRLIATSRTSDAFRVAEVYAYRGDVGESFKWLQAVSEMDDDGVPRMIGGQTVWQMHASPLLAPLHADPRWKAWVADTRVR